MRVIAGTAKGRTLVAPRGTATRPATDRIRETLFAILEPRLDDATVLDLFAGAGTLGIEALSRGARHATFVEREREALDALRRNVATTGFAARADVIPTSVAAYLDKRPGGPFDIVFCDPPFADVGGDEATLAHPALRAALAGDAIVVVRAHAKHLPRLPEYARAVRVKDIGEEKVLFLGYSGDAAGG
jgi:16S rRNA (guanine966-N2)-methyltransferase